MKQLRKANNKPRRAGLTLCLLMLAACAVMLPSCARYAPTPAAPQRTLLDITIQARAQISRNFYYYIAIDTSGSATSDGPREELSGANRLKNWTYYIVLDNGRFYEHFITTEADRDQIPTMMFDLSSPRFQTATVVGDTIHIVMYLDQLITTPRPLRFNFVTSLTPAYETRMEIIPVDYLTPPYLTVQSSALNNPVHSYDYPAISMHVADGTGEEPGDIFDWTVEILQR